MSSNAYVAELQPAPGLRRVVLLSGSALCLIGLLLISGMPVHLAVMIPGMLAWLSFAVWEIARLARGYDDCIRLRFGIDGYLRYLDHDGRWREGRLLRGSVVLSRLAWIRFETVGGNCVSELLRGDCRASHDWRRLQVIWRHIGATG